MHFYFIGLRFELFVFKNKIDLNVFTQFPQIKAGIKYLIIFYFKVNFSQLAD